jgi:hypothetical protein
MLDVQWTLQLHHSPFFTSSTPTLHWYLHLPVSHSLKSLSLPPLATSTLLSDRTLQQSSHQIFDYKSCSWVIHIDWIFFLQLQISSRAKESDCFLLGMCACVSSNFHLCRKLPPPPHMTKDKQRRENTSKLHLKNPNPNPNFAIPSFYDVWLPWVNQHLHWYYGGVASNHSEYPILRLNQATWVQI